MGLPTGGGPNERIKVFSEIWHHFKDHKWLHSEHNRLNQNTSQSLIANTILPTLSMSGFIREN